MNSYHLGALARRLNEAPIGPSTFSSVMRNPYYTALTTTDLSRRYHPLPITTFEPQDHCPNYWTVTATLQSACWLQITIRPALYSDPPSHDWRNLAVDQLRGGVTFRITRQNAMRELYHLRRFVFPSAGEMDVIPCEEPRPDVRAVI